MRLRFSLSHLRVLLLAATLLIGQWLLVQHLAQLEAHATPDGCEWCLTHAPLTGALPTKAVAALPPAAERPLSVIITAAPAAGFRLAPSARAPPRLLVV